MEKSYYECIDEISEEDLYEGLLAHGLFAEKLPPVFTSIPFYNYCLNMRHNFSDDTQDYIRFSCMRNVMIPRQMGIPTPMKYQRLCAVLRDNWDKIKEHFYKNTIGDPHKVSRIHIRKIDNTKSIFKMNYKNWHIDGNPDIELLISESGVSRYLVQTDISMCFPSIYTHAIPWALVGKNISKQNINNKTAWFNRIDFECRNICDGETHGILIGPSASNIISETILTKIDKTLVSDGFKYIRFIDDYRCYVNSYEEGINFLTALEGLLREYDLSLNHTKTKILSLPIAATEHWVHKLNSVHLEAEYGLVPYSAVNAYLDTALKLSEETGNAAVINYAMQTLAGGKLTRNAKELAAKRLMHLAALNPYLMPLMDKYVFEAYAVEASIIKHFSLIVMDESRKVNNYEGISFSIYYSIKYEFEFDDIDIGWLIQQNDCITLILLWIYCINICTSEKRDYFIDELNKKAVDLANDSMGRYWLFCYEALSENQLDGEWKALKRKRVSFIVDEYASGSSH